MAAAGLCQHACLGQGVRKQQVISVRHSAFSGTSLPSASCRTFVRALGSRGRRACLQQVLATQLHNAPWETAPRARLVLEDGSVWHGAAFGHTGTEVGECVFNTSLTGYQEILTDPSYKGQFVVFTYPHIGNVGINPEDMESSQCHLGGVIVRDLSCVVSNYRANMTLDEYLKQQKVLGIANVDTRAITRRLRVTGCLNGVITTDASIPEEKLVEMTKSWTIVGKDLIQEVTCREPYEWKDPTGDEWEFSQAVKGMNGAGPFKVVAYDFGIKHNILRRLASFGCQITVVPADFPAEKVLEMNPDGVFLSNGPGDPSAVPYAVENTKKILGKKPVFGICMGHQVLGQAFGGSTFKLKFGHHGGNHPIRFEPSGRIEISAQNHNFAVDPASLPEGVEVTHVNLNDGTCAGMVYPSQKALAIQYHPESSPGPHDADVCFEMYIDMLKKEREAQKVAA
ncbi:hypothetical protein N2152v2_004855 [Parachlorella kessleri]